MNRILHTKKGVHVKFETSSKTYYKQQYSLNTHLQTHRHSLLAYRHSLLAYRLADKDELRKVAEHQRLPLPG